MPRQKATATQEVTGLVLLGLGLLIFLALISYVPTQAPTWVRHGTHGVRTAGNYIGPVGAFFAWLLYTLLGAAAYLVTAVVLGCGFARLASRSMRLRTKLAWSVVFVFSGACLMEIFAWPLVDAHRLGLAGEGGWLGRHVSDVLVNYALGSVGSLLVLGLIYVSSLILMTGLHPADAVRQAAALPPKWLVQYRAWSAARQKRQREQDAEWERETRERLRREKVNGKKSPAPAPTRTPQLSSRPESLALSDGEEAPLSEEPPRPTPKIFDATVLPPPRPRKEKRDTLPPLSSVSCENYELPSLDLLDSAENDDRQAADPEELRSVQTMIIDTLAQFGLSVAPGDITRGPTITRYEVYPAKGVRVDRILSLERDIARATRAERINILAPIPGKDTVGIEIANSLKQKVTLRELLESDDFHNTKSRIPIALGKDVYGTTIIGDLAAMPHGLVAGTTGSGKSVCINAIIASILYRFTPEDLRFIMIDPKVVEMQVYNSLPHLVVPVVTDPKKVLLAMRWAIDEMEKRYAIFAKTGVRNIGSFNARPKPKSQKELDEEKEKEELEKQAALDAASPPPVEVSPFADVPFDMDPAADDSLAEPVAAQVAAEDEAVLETVPEPAPPTAEQRIVSMTRVRNSREDDLIIPDRMPFIVIIVDELADLMQTAPADVESAIARITQKARAAGIHMIIATQTPRADVITGVIKANVPCRIAFQVASALDSRVILDENGAEKLLGQGDMLYRPPGTSKMIRSQGVLVTDDEIRRLVEHASGQGEPAFEPSIHQKLDGGGDDEEEVSDEDEELVDKCIEVMRQEKKASTSLFQRRLRLGYTRAARILDILETRGYVGVGEGAKPREILVDLDAGDE